MKMILKLLSTNEDNPKFPTECRKFNKSYTAPSFFESEQSGIIESLKKSTQEELSSDNKLTKDQCSLAKMD